MTTPGPVAGRKLHAQDRLATGNPVYNGASNAATFGTVDPSGYVDRERRSGLAKQLLHGTRPRPDQAGPGSADPAMVGETASRMDRGEIIRRLAVRLGGGQSRGN